MNYKVEREVESTEYYIELKGDRRFDVVEIFRTPYVDMKIVPEQREFVTMINYDPSIEDLKEILKCTNAYTLSNWHDAKEL